MPIFLKVLKEAKDFFVQNIVDDRLAINYAIIAAGHAAAFGEENTDFANWILAETRRVKEEYGDEQAVNIFLDDLIAMKTRGLIDGKYWVVDEGKIYLYFHGLYSLWSQEYRKSRGIEPFKAASIRDYMKEEPGFLSVNSYKRIKGEQRKCIVFDLEKSNETIKALTEEPILYA